jgi:hypothetical protein
MSIPMLCLTVRRCGNRLEGFWKHDDRDIDWTEFDHETIKCALSFHYTGDYDPGSYRPVTSSSVQEETKTLGYDEEMASKSREFYINHMST